MLEKFVEEQLHVWKVPGIAVAVVKDDTVSTMEGFGRRNDTDPVTPQTLFAIGSSTKAFTATSIGALVDEGLLEWDTPVREYLPSFRMYDPVATERLTVRDMLSHRSGLPRHDLCWYDEQGFTRVDIVVRLRHLQPNKDLRQVWQYNNLMYLTAGYLAGELAGMTWEALVRTKLLEPLRMLSTNFSVLESQRAKDFALPYDERNEQIIEIPFRLIDLVGPAGSINSSVEDMVAWLRVNLRQGEINGRRVLAAATVREMHAPTMVIPEARLFPGAADIAYGLGWFIGTYREHKVVHHGGNIDGFTALVIFLPNDRMGVVALANKHATSLPIVVAYRAFDELLGLDPIDWSGRLKGQMDALKVGMQESRELKLPVPDAPPSHAIEDYVGTYAHPAYGTFSVRPEDGKLTPLYRTLQLELTHRHYDIFDITVQDFEHMHLEATFVTDLEGNIDAVRVSLEPTVAPIVFQRLPEPPPSLDALVGNYAIRLLVATVGTSPAGRLTVEMPTSGQVTREPYRGLKFK